MLGRKAAERATKRVLNKQDEGLFRKSNFGPRGAEEIFLPPGKNNSNTKSQS